MPDFRPGSGPSQEPESLADIARTDQLLDALAAQRRVRPADPRDAELFALLEDWRDGIRGPSVRRFVSEDEAAAAIQEGLAAQTPKPRPRRGLTVVASLAAGVLAIGGFGALVGGAQPGDSMYGLRTALFGESPSVRDDRVTLAAQTEMAEVQELIERGDWEQAQAKLEQVSTTVQTVDDFEHKTELVQQWNELSVKVGTRDAQATLPAVAPGAPSVPPPPGVTLLELPAVVAPTTTAPSDEPTVPAEDDATTTVPSETTGPSEPTTEPTEPGETTEPGTEPTESDAAEPSEEPGTPSTEPTTEPTEPPATPTSTATPTPTSSTSTPSPTSTPAPTSSAVRTTTSSAPPVAEAPEPTTVPTTAVEIETSAPEVSVPESVEVEVEEEVVTTTADSPLIELPIPDLN